VATVQQTVTRALRTIRVLEASGTPTGADMSTGLQILNSMMARWEADGLALGWVAVTSPSEDLPVPAEADEAIVYNLAARMGMEYGQPLSRELAYAAQSNYDALLRDRIVEMPLNQKNGLPVPDYSFTFNYNAFYNGVY
jgi:hypothetical protein